MAAEGLSGHRLAELSVAIGDLEGAITNLTYALEKRDPTMIVIGTDQAFDPLRQDPRFIRMIEELRLPNGATRVSR
jgi:hypothetical protein